MYKKIVVGALSVALVAGVAIWLVNGQDTEPAPADTTRQTSNQTAQNEQAADNEQYTAYSEAELANEYDRHILFFYASWCPECVAFKQSLLNNDIPQEVQVLEVNYDTATELKQKYGVTIQTTFVEVDEQGNQTAKWVGYGQDKSFGAIDAGLSGG